MKFGISMVVTGLLLVTTAVAAGGPSKEFLARELHVTPGPGIAPGPSGFSVKQIVGALEGSKTSWKSLGKGQWRATVTKVDPTTRRYLTVKILFVGIGDDTGKGALMKRVNANGQELNLGQIFQFAQQLAFKAEAKK